MRGLLRWLMGFVPVGALSEDFCTSGFLESAASCVESILESQVVDPSSDPSSSFVVSSDDSPAEASPSSDRGQETGPAARRRSRQRPRRPEDLTEEDLEQIPPPGPPGNEAEGSQVRGTK